MSTRPASMAIRIAALLETRPTERLRCYEIADALGVPTQKVASECGRLYRRGTVDRTREEVPGLRQPITYYHAKATD